MKKSKWVVVGVTLVVVMLLSLFGCSTPAPTPTSTQAPSPAQTTTAVPKTTPAPATTTTAAAPSPTSKPAQQIVWKFFTARNYNTDTTAEMKRILDGTEKATGGRLKIEQYWVGQHPYKAEDLIPSVKSGTIDGTISELEKLAGLVPDLAIINLPGLMPALAQRDKFHERLPEVLDPYFRKEWNQFMTPISYCVNREGIFTKQMLLTKDGLKGQKIRVFGPPTAKLVQLFGGTPQTIAANEMYTAVQRGILDGVLTGMTGAQENKIFEVTKYANMWGLYQSDYWVHFGLASWNKLPKDLQDTVMKYWTDESPSVLKVHDFSELLVAEQAMSKYGTVLYATPSDVLQSISAQAQTSIWPDFTSNAGPLGKQILDLAGQILGKKLS